MADDTLHDAALLYERALTSRGAAGERLARLAEEAAVRALDRELLGADEHRGRERAPCRDPLDRGPASPPAGATNGDARCARRIG